MARTRSSWQLSVAIAITTAAVLQSSGRPASHTGMVGVAFAMSTPATPTSHHGRWGTKITARSAISSSPSSPIRPTPSTRTTRTRRSTTARSVSVSTAPSGTTVAGSSNDDTTSVKNHPLPPLGEDGIYHISTPEEHAALMAHASDSLVALKVFAPWCRACKGLEPKFQKLVTEANYNDGVPILWASLSIQHNKAFVQSLGVLALPTIQFYVGGKLLDTFPCGPSKVPILRRKLTALIADHVYDNGTIRPESIALAAAAAEDSAKKVKEAAVKKEAAKQKKKLESQQAFQEVVAASTGSASLTKEDRNSLTKIPYFSGLGLADLDDVLDKAVHMTFEPGAILVREGKPGRCFYVIQEGEVEICQKQAMMVDNENYLGTVVNRLSQGDYFGERALITGEPRAASIRVSDQPLKLWAFDKDIFPASSVLSGQSKNTASSSVIQVVNDKYGVNMTNSVDVPSTPTSTSGSDSTGGATTPASTDISEDSVTLTTSVANVPLSAAGTTNADLDKVKGDDDAIFSLLTKFRMIRHVGTCFRYIKTTRAVWGDPGSRTRRNMLVDRLSPTQRTEFTEIFHLMDQNGDGFIELAELKRLMESIGEGQSDDELKFVLQPGASVSESKNMMTFDDYMGIMAESEFYHLFRDIFASLDENGSGFVKARELDRVLCGVRDLISDDRKSVIDVDDKDMLIDYEQFSRMLLGTTLI